jgi:hypothetical protein
MTYTSDWLINDRADLSLERAPYIEETEVYSWAPDGARHQGGLTDWLTDRPSVVTLYSACHLLSRWYSARLIRSRSLRRYVPPKRLLTFDALHGVVSQKIVLFTAAAVRTSNPVFVNNVPFYFRVCCSTVLLILPAFLCHLLELYKSLLWCEIATSRCAHFPPDPIACQYHNTYEVKLYRRNSCIKNSARSLICCIMSRTINLPFFLPCSSVVMHSIEWDVEVNYGAISHK